MSTPVHNVHLRSRRLAPRRMAAATIALARREPFYVGAVAIYLLLRIAALEGVAISSDVDTSAYRLTASFSLLSHHFWAGGRPWLTPLMYKVVGSGAGAIAMQSLVATACWLALAAAVARTARNRPLRRAAFALVLLLGLSYNVLQWDQWLSSDSLSLSLACLVVAGLLESLTRPTRGRIAGLAFVALLWAADRDTNALVALVLFAPIGVALIALRFRRQGAVLLVTGLAIVLMSNLSSNGDHRWDYAMLDVISHRVLPSPSTTRYFVDHGMPLSPQVMSWNGEQAGTFWVAFNTSPELAQFRSWFFPHMQGTYERFLLEHPTRTISGPIGDLPTMISPNVQNYIAPSLHRVLPGLADRLLYPRDRVSIVLYTVWLVVFGAICAFLSPTRLWLIPLVVAISTLPHAIFVWNGEPLNIDKHAITLALLYRITMLVTAVLVVDSTIERRGHRERST